MLPNIFKIFFAATIFFVISITSKAQCPDFGLTVSETKDACFGFNDGHIGVKLSGGAGGYTTANFGLFIRIGLAYTPIAATVAVFNGDSIVYTGLIPSVEIVPLSNYVVKFTDPSCAGGIIWDIYDNPLNRNTEISANGTTTEVCTVNDGEIFVAPSGGTGPYGLVWSGGPTPIADDEANPQNLQSGSYDLIITDAIGCTLDTTLVVGSAPDATLSASGTTSICIGSTTTVQVAINNGVGPYTVVIDTTGAGTNRTVNNYASGSNIIVGPTSTYTYSLVSVTDGNGCIASLIGSVDINVEALPAIFDVSGGGSYCAGTPVGQAIGLLGSEAGVSYILVRDGATDVETIPGTGAALAFTAQTILGTYSVRAESASSCTSAMNGNAEVSEDPIPAVFNVSGGGSYCVGIPVAQAIGLSGSETGVNYILVRGGATDVETIAGTGGILAFTAQTIVSTYTIRAESQSASCISAMAGSAIVSEDPLPTAFNVTGGGSYCVGTPVAQAIGLSGSEVGVNYILERDGSTDVETIPGSGAALAFTTQTLVGTYTVRAESAASCTATMSGNAVVSEDALPTDFTVTGGGSYCAGTPVAQAIGLSGSVIGVNYILVRGGATDVETIAGTGGALAFTLQTIVSAYTVRAENAASCTAIMTGSASIIEDPIPAVFNVSGGGSYCVGTPVAQAIGLPGSEIGVNYILVRGGVTDVETVAGTGGILAFTPQTIVGTYTVRAESQAASCTSAMTGSALVSEDPLPIAFNVSGGGSYCVGSPVAQAIGLSGSEAGVNYILVLNGTTDVETIGGTGAVLAFTAQTIVGSYTVRSESAATCTAMMSGNAVISEDPLPTAFNVSGGGSYCIGTPVAQAVGLSGSEAGVNYTLVRDGATDVETIGGTGGILAFTAQTIGTYTVRADNVATCSATMTGTAVVIADPLPAVFSVSGGGSYCVGSPVAQAIGLSGSEAGVNYILVLNGTTDVETVGGTGAALAFTSQTIAGTYTVRAEIGAALCTSAMTGNAVVIADPAPADFNVSGGGSYCVGTPVAQAIGLSGSEIGVNYILELNGTTDVETIGGTGAVLAFTSQTTVGTYTVRAENVATCTSTMTGSAVVIADPIPAVFNVSGGGSYCVGTPVAQAIGLSGSEIGVNYILVLNGTTDVETIGGTGAVLAFTSQTTAGSYTVRAEIGAASCTSAMTGNAVVTADPVPAVFNVSGGGSYCIGTPVAQAIGLSGSEIGVNYILVLNGTTDIETIGGTGAALAFTSQTTVGTYTIRAENIATCSSAMNGSAAVSENPIPVPLTITGNANPACQAAGEVYSVSGPANSNYSWTIPVGATIVGASNGSSITVDFAFADGDITVIETDINGCSGPQATLGIVLQTCPLTADFVADNLIVCIGSPVTFTDASSVSTGVTYSWDFGIDATPATDNTSGPIVVSYSTPGLKTVSLIIDDGAQSNTTTKIDYIDVRPLPTAVLSGDAAICAGSSPVLTFDLTGTGPWDIEYQDDLGNSFPVTGIISTPHLLSVSPVVPTTYTMVSVDDALCSGTVSGSADITFPPPKEVTIRLDSISGLPGSKVSVPLRVINYKDLTTMQFTIAWDANLLTYDEVSNITIGNVSAASFGTTDINNGFLTFSWNTSSWGDTTIVDSTAIFSIDFDAANTLCPNAYVTIDESPTAITVIELADEIACIANTTIKGGNVEIPATASITSNDADNLICFGDQVIFTGLPGGMTNYTFYLNGVEVQNGANSVYINSALVDQDSVSAIVGDAQGCTLSTQGIVTTVNQITVTPTVTDISACGLSDGAITLAVAGGSGTYSFNWTGPSISGADSILQDQSNLARGFYNVTITDDVSGCTEVLNIELKEPVAFTLTATKVDVSTTGGSDGSIDLTVAGATPSFTVDWVGPNGFTSTDEDINGLSAGTYTATVVDAGCTDAITVDVTQPINALVLNATKTDVSTCSASDGTINLLISGGSGSYAISWTGPNSFSSTDQNLSGLEGGTYITTVVDLVTSLTAQWSVQLDEPEGFSLDATVSDISYCAGADGAITLNVVGGSGIFTFAWRDLEGLGFTSADKDIIDLAIADYRVVVTDSGTGCIDSLNATVGRPAICDLPCSINASISTNSTTCPDSLNGSATTFIISGGSGFGNYYISLDTGVTYMPFDGDFATAISDLGKGSHLFKVKDTVTSCTQELVANVAVSSILAAQISVEDAGCNGGDGKIVFNVSGLSPIEVKLIYRDGTELTQIGSSLITFNDLDSGAYYYEIKEDINNNDGCSILASDSIRLINDCEITPPCTTLTATAHSFEDATCGSDPNGKAIIDVTGGSSPYEYTTDGANWIPFISGNVIDQLPPDGMYNIVVRQDTLNVNCRAEVAVNINGPALIILEEPIISTQAATCNQNDGAVKIGRVTGGIPTYNYQIDGSPLVLPADSIVTNLGAGIHTFTVTDAVLCTEDFPFEVDSPGVIVASVTDVPVSCTSIFLKAGIRIELDLDSTTLPGPYEAYVARTGDPENGTTYQIPDNGLKTVLNLDKDFYSVVVQSSDDGGCNYSETVAVFGGAYPLDFDIIDSDSIVNCIGDYGSITIGNVVGDPDTTYIVQLISESNVILETYQLSRYELEGGFTIDESNTDELFAGKYYIKMIQNQSECAGVEAISELITIYEPLGELGLDIIEEDEEDGLSLADIPTGYIRGEIIQSGGNPYEAIIQLIEPVFEMNISDIIYFNEQREWEEVPNTGDNANRYPVKFDSLWAGLYEMTVRDVYGCEFSVEHSVSYDETIFIPNVFTPNNDGYNDNFYIRNLPESGTKLVISNRNGFVVYESDNYNEDNLWDGETVADGTYYYNLTMPDGAIFKGWLEKWSGSRP